MSRMIFMSLMVLLNLSSHVLASSERAKSELKVLMVGEHKIYTTSLQLPSGEMAYFACEPITDKARADQWYAYRDSSARFCCNNVGIIPGACIYYDSGALEEIMEKFFPVKTTNSQIFSALITGVKDKKKMGTALRSIASGAIGMSFSVDTCITYISKKPIEGFFPLPVVGTPITIDDYMNFYDDLILSVSSYGYDGSIYVHRGIFRNPFSMLRKDFKGCALLLHAFTAIATSAKYPDLKYMKVNPDANVLMRYLLLVNFSPEEIFVGYSLIYYLDDPKYASLVAKFAPEFQRDFPEDVLNNPGHIHIDIDALKRKFPMVGLSE